MRWLTQSHNRGVRNRLLAFFVSAMAMSVGAGSLFPRPGIAATGVLSVSSVPLTPQDTYINLDTNNYSAQATLNLYTWPDYQAANVVLMKFDLTKLPAGSTVQSAMLRMALVQSDTTPDATYTITVHKITGKNPVLTKSTGYTSDGTTAWTANTCCSNGVPLAEGDISAPYDTQVIDKINEYKSWNVTAMVQEWMQDPTKNYGLLLNSDTTRAKDRFRTFASSEHPTTTLRPYLDVTVTAADTTPPAVAITAPASGTTASGALAVSANAIDNIGVAGVQFQLNGANLGAEVTALPYGLNWDTTTVSDGTYTLTAVARDLSGNTATSAGVSATIRNGLLVLPPQDTYISLDTTNYSTQPSLGIYTWPDNQIANAILMKFDLSAIPQGAVIQSANLRLSLIQSDTANPTYTITAHKLMGKNPAIAQATGFTFDGANAWTANSCCYNNVPEAQADISPAYDTRAVDQTAGAKSWTVTPMVQEWVTSPSTNFGLLLNADTSKPKDSFRTFASTRNPDTTLRPILAIAYSTAGSGDTTAPTATVTAPAAGTTVSGTVSVTAAASDNVGVAGVQFKLDGVNLGAEDTTAPYSVSWNAASSSSGAHVLTAVARDAAGNLGTSPAVSVTVNNPDKTAPTIAITSPAAGGTVTGVVGLAVNAADNVGVASVQYRLDSANLGAPVTTAPFTMPWTTTTASNGKHYLTAVARDGAGNSTTSKSVRVTVSNVNDTTSPTVAITAPASGSTVSGTVSVTASAADNVGVVGVQFKLDGANLGAEDTASPYSTSWNTATATAGAHTLAAVARDAAGNTTTSASVSVTVQNADTTAPTVSITTPVTGATVSGVVGLAVNATDNVGVVGVQYKLDGANVGAEVTAPPFASSWGTTAAGNGSHTLAAVARDAAGNKTTSTAVSVTVSNGDTTPPVLSGIGASAITSSGAVIGWTTNEASDSQVDYGTSTAYGSTTTLNASIVTAHSVTLGGLAASTGYHYRVRSRDAAGNLAVSGDATFTTAAASASGSWSNEPSGFTTFLDNPMDSLTGTGWNLNNSNGYASVSSDAAAPISPPSVGQWMYPQGFQGGYEPAILSHALPSSFSEGFVGVDWKPSNPWQGHSSGVNKVFFLFGSGCGNLIPIMYGPPGGPYELRVAPEWGNWNWLTPNVNSGTVTLGAWHRIELYFKASTGGSGIVRWWMDGVLIGNYTNVTFPSMNCFDEFQFAPTWGGVGDTKSETDYFWFDHAHISVPGTGSSSGDTTPPTVSMTAPAAGATVSGSTTVSATASDNVGVAGVQFKLDGANLGAEVTSSPYSIAWNTTSASNGSHTLSAVARDAAGNQTTAAGMTVNVSNSGTTGGPPPGTLLFQEGFEDTNVAARGWYDNTNVLLSSTEHAAGSTNSIQYTFNQGATTPTAGSALRHTFTATDSIYLSYWVKYSTNWVGSQQPYHPHEFYFLTTKDDIWSGLSFDYLTTYVEQNGGTPLVGIQDGSNIDQSQIGVNLVGVTENRGVAGCNGSTDGYPDNCYSNGSQYVNEKKWRAPGQYFTDATGPYYKSDWHHVEAYVKMNSIQGGIGVNDGMVQYWFDGQPVIDNRNVLLRTGANAAMQFNQFIIAPYIGDGSPVTQTVWYDNVTVGTGKP